VNFDTSLKFAVARSIDDPGVVVPNVDPPPDDTVIATGALVVEALWLSVTRNLALYVPALVYVNDGF
jgi:hypothetical protein